MLASYQDCVMSTYSTYLFMPQTPWPSCISKRMKPLSPHQVPQEFWIFQ